MLEEATGPAGAALLGSDGRRVDRRTPLRETGVTWYGVGRP
jgi:hypothetical protein